MDTILLIGTWCVESFTVKEKMTETPNGWVEFSFFDDGTVIQTITRPDNHNTDKIERRWWVDDGRVNIHQEGRLAWNVKYLTRDRLVLSQDNDAVVYTCAKVNEGG